MLALCTDDVGANAAMTAKLELPFPLLSDPDGEGAIGPFGVWNEEEREAYPATIALGPDGSELFRHVGADYADRPTEDGAFEGVRALELPPRERRHTVHPHVEPRPSGEAYPRERLEPYFRGVSSLAKALHARTGSEDAGRAAEMAGRFVAALRGR